MSKHIQTLRIGLALFLSVFGTSALPTASAYALEEVSASESQPVEAPPADPLPVDTPEVVPPAEETQIPDAPPPEEPLTLPTTTESSPPAEDTVAEETPVVEQQSEQPQIVENNLRITQQNEVLDVQILKKVTICHRTASYTNPYVEITVDVSAADGMAGNSGSEPDHYGEHKGPLFSSGLPKHTEWGDIIPAIDGVHAGQNLAGGGQAILDAGCVVPVELEVEPSACVIGENTTGSLTIWVYGSANGTKVTVTKGGDVVTFFNNVNENTVMPLSVTGLGSGEYVVSVEKGKDTLASETVNINTCPPIEIPLPQPTVNDPCDEGNATWIVPANTDQFTWELNKDNELVVTAIAPYVFPGEETSHNYGTPEETNTSPCPIEVTPVEPTVIDVCYLDKDAVYIGYTEGVIYKVNGQKAKGWVHFNGATLTVTAQPKEGYVFPEGAVASWTYDSSDFTDQQCLTITKSAKVASDTNLDGKIGVGDTVTWEITVTNTSDKEYEHFYVLVEDANTVLEDDGYIGYLGAGDSKTLTATSTITASDLAACKVVNIAAFTGWRAQARDLQASLQLDEEEEVLEPIATGSSTATYTLDCPQPGRGEVLGVTTQKTPPAATPQVLPATIPATGASDSSNLYLILGLVFSAMTYFGMLRRYQEA